MSDRYIRRFALPERLYTASAPVVLAAGVLLEDTRLPRLVAQLKWKSIDARPLTALTVSVRCPAEAGGDGGETVFTYSGLRSPRGQAFGVYTAVVLPWGDQQTIEVRALSADFADGTRWEAPEGARWAPLPAFVPLAQAVEEPELLALSAILPRNQYVFWSGQGLWYCPCGGVNHEEETACHRCGCSRAEAERLATAEGLRQVGRERAEEQARLAQEEAQRREEARAQAEARKDAARQQLSGLKARFRRGPAPAETSQEAPEPLTAREIVPEPLEAPSAEPPEVSAPMDGGDAGTLTPAPEQAPAAQGKTTPIPAAKPRRRGKKALGIAAVVVLLAAGFFFLSRLLGGTDADIGITGVRVLHVTAPGDGETALFTVEEDDEGVCTVTPELVREQIPGVEYLNLDGVPDMGDDIDPYLINSFQMAMLVTSRGEYGSENEWGSFDANRDPDSPLCLLLYDSNFHLMGHAVGVPQEAGDGQWQLEVTLCDYDFTALYEQQLSDFQSQREETFAHYIAPEDIVDSGAEFFLEGYNTGRGPTLLPGDAQAYHLWAQYTSHYVEQHSRGLDRLKDRLPRDDRWRAYLLLDEDYQLLGYTMMDSTGAGGQVNDTDITPMGTVDLILEENDQGQCEFTEELLRQAVPEMDFFNFGGYTPDLSGDVKAYVKDSLHMAWLVTSQGRERGGHSSAIWNLTDDQIFTLLLYSDFTTLCGYFIGAPEDLGGGQWRMELTLCDYNFSALYEEQAAGYTAAPQLPEISQDDIASCGAAWYIEPVDQLYGADSFYHRLRLQSLWSRGTSPYISRFRHPISELHNVVRWATEEFPHDYLLLDASGQYLGYVTITDGERVAAMDFTSSGSRAANTGTVSLDLTAEGEYCPLTLEQVQRVVPQTQSMEFRGMPALGGVEEYLKVSDQMAWLVASDGAQSMQQTSGRFSVQGGKVPFRVLLLYSGPTTLCGYFFGKPSHVGGNTWRMEITLCDYDFSGLYAQQKKAFDQTALPKYIAPEQVSKSGAVWCIDGFYLSDNGDFSQKVQQYGLWSREQSTGMERFCKSVDDLDQLVPRSSKDIWAYVLLLDKDYRSIGYTNLTA